MLQIAEGRVAGPEVIHCQVETHRTKRMERLGSLTMVVHQHAFGQLQTEVARLQTTDLKCPTDGVGQAALELPARQIDADPNARESGVLPGPVLQAGTL